MSTVFDRKAALLRGLLALSLAGPPTLLGAVEPAEAASPRSEPATVRVVVEAGELGDTSEVYEEVIGERIAALLRDSGYVLDDSVRADATLRVRVSFYNAADLDYQVEFDISAGAEIVRLETLACPQCADEDLLRSIEGRGPQILTGLERALATVAGAAEPASAEIAEPGTEGGSAPRRAFGVLGGVGIGVAGLGVGLLVGGGVELARGRVYDEVSRTPTRRTGVDHRPVGVALLSGGGVVLTAGVTMLVVNVVRTRQRRERTTAAVPLLGPEFVGLGLAGQF